MAGKMEGPGPGFLRSWTALVLLLAPALAPGCGWKRQPGPSPPVVILDVRNHSFFDVVIYALPSPASQTRIRLGNVIGFATAELRVPVSALRQGAILALYLHAVGSSRSWTSPEVTVMSGVRPCLDIHSDASGDLSRSVFYSRIATDSSGHCSMTPATRSTDRGFTMAGVVRRAR